MTQAEMESVAERLWWCGRKGKRLPAAHRLTVKQIDEARKMPAYQKYVETLMLGQRSPKNFEKWVKDLSPGMPESFGGRMGLDPKVVPGMLGRVRQAHAEIAAGEKQTPMIRFDPYNREVDASEVEVIGCSDHWEFVYLYYFSTDQRDSFPSDYFPCKIGRTRNIIVERIAEQEIVKRHWEKARLALVFRTDDSVGLESSIHDALKRRRKKTNPPLEDIDGREWFRTNPTEVKGVFDHEIRNRGLGLL